MATFGTFRKGEHSKVAYTPAERIQLQFEGWEQTDDPASDGPPPRAGRGSGRDAWVAYAGRFDVAVSDAMQRDDIIAALDDQGVPTSE